MRSRLVPAIAAVALLLGSGSAFAISCPDPIGSYDYQGYLTPATDCRFQDGNVTAADVNGWWPSGWAEVSELTGVGSSGYLTATASPSWGQPPIEGTWQISQAFWDTYGEAVISFHIGQGNTDISGWAFVVTPNSLSGTWGILDPSSLTGNGLSNIKLFGRGEPSSSSSSSSSSGEPSTSSSSGTDVPEPASSLVLLGLGLLGLGFMRRRALNA